MNATRIAVFYDGAYFKSGNIYFRYKANKGWFSLPRLHTLFERWIAQQEKVPAESAKVVEAGYYDGRMSSRAARDDQLSKERDFELALVDAGIVPHYLAVRETQKDDANADAGFQLAQKGIDVCMALDCLDRAHEDRFDVAVLLTGDEDFVPLARKVTSLGKRVLVAHFEIAEWKDERSHLHRGTYISKKLQSAASYTLNFNSLVSEQNWQSDVCSLFFKPGGEN